MDISKWPMERIMQLPVEAFGTRFAITFSKSIVGAEISHFFSELTLPNRCILHELSVGSATTSLNVAATSLEVGFALGQKAVTTAEQFNALEQLIPGFDELALTIKIVRPPMYLTRLKMPINAQGRHLVCRIRNGTIFTTQAIVGLVFSAVPREIPDWMVSSESDQLDEMIRLLRIGVKIR